MANAKRSVKWIAGLALGAGLAGAAQAQPYGGMMGGYGMGPGMMGGWGGMGPGMMGPGMMGPGTGGYGMMGPGMGPGMMGGYGGMMGPGMMGPGMMGGYWGPDLGLTEQQRSQIAKIQEEQQKKRWDLGRQLWDEQSKLRELLWAEKRDAKQIGEQNRKVYDLRRQMAEAGLEAHTKIEALLNKEQKERWRRMPWWMDE